MYFNIYFAFITSAEMNIAVYVFNGLRLVKALVKTLSSKFLKNTSFFYYNCILNNRKSCVGTVTKNFQQSYNF